MCSLYPQTDEPLFSWTWKFKISLEIEDVLKFDSSDEAFKPIAGLKITKIQNYLIHMFEDMTNASILPEKKVSL